MKKWLVRSGVLVLLVLVVAALRWTIFAPDPVVVRTTAAGRGRVEATITNTQAGTVRARRRAGLSTGTAGIVSSLEIARGDRVECGELLLRLEDTKQRSELLYAERQLAVAEARNARACVVAERARREWERNELLAQEQVVSADRLDALKTAHEVAVSDCHVAATEVSLAAAAVEVARAELDKTELRAPFDAIIADVSVEVGEWVTPSVPLVTAPDLIDAIDPSSLYVSAPMDEVDAELLGTNQRVRVTIDSHPDQSFEGRVVRLAPYVLDAEQQNRTLEIEVELDDAELAAQLLPGTSADVEVELEVREDALRIPTYALMEGSRVLVFEGRRLAQRQVATGIRNWDWTEVTGGLEVGDEVVTDLDRLEVKAGVVAVAQAPEVAP